MGTLLTAVLILGGLAGVIFLYIALNEKVNDWTGLSISEWISSFIATTIFSAITLGGGWLVKFGMTYPENVLITIVGLIITATGGFLLWYLWRNGIPDIDSSGSPIMSGKRTHYDSSGNITGYSDKD